MLSTPSRRVDGSWEIVFAESKVADGWWWLTVVRPECSATGVSFDPPCSTVTPLSESVKTQIVHPEEVIIQADWVCHWECGLVEEIGD